MENLCDANVLLAVCYRGHAHHERALQWVSRVNTPKALVVCRTAQLALLRLLNNPAVMGSDVCTADRAWQINDELLCDDRFVFQHEPPGLEASLRTLTTGFGFSPKQWQDAYLAAFAMRSGLRVLTFDKGYRKFAGLDCEILETESD